MTARNNNAVGDLRNNLEKLKLELRNTGGSKVFQEDGLSDGRPASVLKIVHFVLLDYSRLVARLLSNNGYRLLSCSDQRFTETFLKILRNEFSYRPQLTQEQLLANGYAERKVILLCDLLKLVKRKHKEVYLAQYKMSKPGGPLDDGEQMFQSDPIRSSNGRDDSNQISSSDTSIGSGSNNSSPVQQSTDHQATEINAVQVGERTGHENDIDKSFVNLQSQTARARVKRSNSREVDNEIQFSHFMDGHCNRRGASGSTTEDGEAYSEPGLTSPLSRPTSAQSSEIMERPGSTPLPNTSGKSGQNSNNLQPQVPVLKSSGSSSSLVEMYKNSLQNRSHRLGPIKATRDQPVVSDPSKFDGQFVHTLNHHISSPYTDIALRRHVHATTTGTSPQDRARERGMEKWVTPTPHTTGTVASTSSGFHNTHIGSSLYHQHTPVVTARSHSSGATNLGYQRETDMDCHSEISEGAISAPAMLATDQQSQVSVQSVSGSVGGVTSPTHSSLLKQRQKLLLHSPTRAPQNSRRQGRYSMSPTVGRIVSTPSMNVVPGQGPNASPITLGTDIWYSPSSATIERTTISRGTDRGQLNQATNDSQVPQQRPVPGNISRMLKLGEKQSSSSDSVEPIVRVPGLDGISLAEAANIAASIGANVQNSSAKEDDVENKQHLVNSRSNSMSKTAKQQSTRNSASVREPKLVKKSTFRAAAKVNSGSKHALRRGEEVSLQSNSTTITSNATEIGDKKLGKSQSQSIRATREAENSDVHVPATSSTSRNEDSQRSPLPGTPNGIINANHETSVPTSKSRNPGISSHSSASFTATSSQDFPPPGTTSAQFDQFLSLLQKLAVVPDRIKGVEDRVTDMVAQVNDKINFLNHRLDDVCKRLDRAGFASNVPSNDVEVDDSDDGEDENPFLEESSDDGDSGKFEENSLLHVPLHGQYNSCTTSVAENSIDSLSHDSSEYEDVEQERLRTQSQQFPDFISGIQDRFRQTASYLEHLNNEQPSATHLG